MYFFFREIVGEIWKEKLRTFFVKSMKTVLTKFFSLLCCKTTYAHFTENSFSRETAKSPSWQTITDFTKKFNEIIPRAFHSVEKCYKTRSRFLRKNQHFFREINVFTKKVTKELISRFFFFLRDRVSYYFSTLCIPYWIFSVKSKCFDENFVLS